MTHLLRSAMTLMVDWSKANISSRQEMHCSCMRDCATSNRHAHTSRYCR